MCSQLDALHWHDFVKMFHGVELVQLSTFSHRLECLFSFQFYEFYLPIFACLLRYIILQLLEAVVVCVCDYLRLPFAVCALWVSNCLSAQCRSLLFSSESSGLLAQLTFVIWSFPQFEELCPAQEAVCINFHESLSS
jgi:hypothetical protein